MGRTHGSARPARAKNVAYCRAPPKTHAVAIWHNVRAEGHIAMEVCISWRFFV